MSDQHKHEPLDFRLLIQLINRPHGYEFVSFHDQMEAMMKTIRGLKVGEVIIRLNGGDFIDGAGI